MLASTQVARAIRSDSGVYWQRADSVPCGDLGLSALFSDVSGARNSETNLLAGEEMQRALAHNVIRRTCRFAPRKKKKRRRRETA